MNKQEQNKLIKRVERSCGPLTERQKIMVLHHAENKEIFIARPQGGAGDCPAFRMGGDKGALNIIDPSGYYQLAAVSSAFRIKE